jgi:DNA invertase Pin-like site-specific DNA recombinase
MARRPTKRVAVYTRTSSKANLGGASTARQRSVAHAALAGASEQLKQHVENVSEVVSGMLPLDQRTKLKELLDGQHVTKVFVESARAIARNAMVAEQAWQLSRDNGVEIIAADLPQLFKHNPNPGETLMRRVMLAVQEFERDMIVLRLSHGLARKKPSSTRRTQAGTVKVNGALSLLEKCKPNKRQMAQMVKLTKMHDASEIGWRPLAERLSRALKLESDMAVETARRLKQELQQKMG